MSTETVIPDLVAVLSSVTDGRLDDVVDPAAPNSLRRLGLDSVTLLAFLVAVEDAFGIEWEDDLPEDVLGSFDAMGRYILDNLGGDRS